jgi:hypothetical protein
MLVTCLDLNLLELVCMYVCMYTATVVSLCLYMTGNQEADEFQWLSS